jgi:general secretion pathway protein F
MPVYKFVSVDDTGRTTTGLLEGDSPQHIRQQLRDKGMIPIDLWEEKKGFIIEGFFSKKNSISHNALSTFTYQLSVLLSAGLSLDAALLNIIQQMTYTPFQKILLTIHTQVREGNSLASSLNNYPEIFPKLYRAIISVGEKSGKMEKVVNELSTYLENQETIRQKIHQSLIYPSLLMSVSILILVFLLTYAMPKITDVFKQTGQALPDVTLVLLIISNTLKVYGIYILIFLIAISISFKKLLKVKKFRTYVHLVLLKLPIISKTIININSARFLRTLGILFSASVSVLDALKTANQTVTLIPMSEAIDKAINQVVEGVNIHEALINTHFFSKISTQLIAIGETTGQLDHMLEKAAYNQEQHLLRMISTALAMFEPLMIIVMGMIVLFIVLAILLPIFAMNQFVS